MLRRARPDFFREVTNTSKNVTTLLVFVVAVVVFCLFVCLLSVTPALLRDKTVGL